MRGIIGAKRSSGSTALPSNRFGRIRHLTYGGVAAVLLTVATPSANAKESKSRGSPASTVSAQVSARGAGIFENICGKCHQGQVPRAPTKSLLETLPPAAIVRTLRVGAMRSIGDSLRLDDQVAVAEYITGRTLETAAERPLPRCKSGAKFSLDDPPSYFGWGLEDSNARYIDPRISGLDATNLDSLHLKWAFAFPGATMARSQPAIAGGSIIVGSGAGVVYSLDRHRGCVRWEFQATAEVRTGIAISPWRRGDHQARPIVYFGDMVGNVYAVRAADGVLVWKAHPDDHPSATITATPTLFDGRLYVAVSSLEEGDPGIDCCRFRGSMVAYSAETGHEVWRTYMVPPAAEIATFSSGRRLVGPSGIGLWNTPAIDAKRGLIYFGTGDNYSPPATSMSDAVVALELATGKIRWVHQTTAGDVWTVACLPPVQQTCLTPDSPDWDFGAASILASSGDGRDLVVSGQKSGWVYAMDPDTGQLAWKTRLGRGGINAGIYFGMSVHNGSVFVPIADLPDGKTYDLPPRPGLYALSLSTGDVVWSSINSPSDCDHKDIGCAPSIFAPPTTTGDLVFVGGSDGRLRAYSATSGKVLWQFDTAQNFSAIGGHVARGGSIGTGVVMTDGALIVNSGYGYGQMTGNALLVLEASSGHK